MEAVIADIRHELAADLDGAFPDLVRSRQDRIFSGVLRMVRHHADAADITQETFIRAYRALGGYEPARIEAMSLDGWLWTIAINLCRNRGRSRSPVPATIPEQPDRSVGPEELALRSTEEARWQQRLLALSPAQRAAVVLRHVVGLGYDEIAEATGRPVGTVKADVHRALTRLRRMVEREEAT
ncbi:MAG: sigma-70 family RNA polymerase sigma factor [Actinobacteria bacterium]|nr:MAG: sigma-70 family RNA polymerase sigma factor [Actinomycetota bacterium]